MDEIKSIDAWLKATGRKESRLGQLSCANPHAVKRIRDGSATIRTLHAVQAYIAANPAKKAKK